MSNVILQHNILIRTKICHCKTQWFQSFNETTEQYYTNRACFLLGER